MNPCRPARSASRALRSGSRTATTLQGCRFDDVGADCAAATRAVLVGHFAGGEPAHRPVRELEREHLAPDIDGHRGIAVPGGGALEQVVHNNTIAIGPIGLIEWIGR